MQLKERTRNELRGEIYKQRETIVSMTKKLGWSKNVLGRKLNGEVDFTWDEVQQLIDTLGIRDDADALHRILF